ncbi:MAG TPA: GGDEF domain-containing protein [Alphaproteobacteria bacterium]|jgi:diguanylate cyclase (GGDEF)-like protein|nr:GGDEF domain-containing protein [Alphaproteobacteria bacterium]
MGEDQEIDVNDIDQVAAAFEVNDDLGNIKKQDGTSLLGSDDGTKIINKYLEAEKGNKDPLTGLLNRRGVKEEFDKIREVLLREPGSLENVGLVALDLIGLHKVNDDKKLGPKVGDSMLQTAANHLSSSVRSMDLVSRWGGDEYLLVLLNITRENLIKVIEKMNSNLPDGIHFNIGFKNVGGYIDYKEEMENIMGRLNDIKEARPRDAAGRSTGEGAVIDLNEDIRIHEYV